MKCHFWFLTLTTCGEEFPRAMKCHLVLNLTTSGEEFPRAMKCHLVLTLTTGGEEFLRAMLALVFAVGTGVVKSFCGK